MVYAFRRARQENNPNTERGTAGKNESASNAFTLSREIKDRVKAMFIYYSSMYLLSALRRWVGVTRV